MTIVLLHAFPLDSRMWESQRAALAEVGYDIVAPDLPGAEAEVGMDVWARRILRLVEGDFIAVGNSMGGYLAFELWRQAGGRTRALVLVDTRAAPDTPEGRQGRDDTIRVLTEEGFGPFWDGLAPKLFAPGADADVVARARELAAAQPVTGLVATLETLRDRPDSRPTLPSIDVPALVVVGEEDTLTPPSEAEAMVAALPAGRLVRVPGAGHLAPLERPRNVNEAVLAFLAEVAA
jgi:pimeloyl-ACP methyl ester carboxylesterase